MEIKQVTIDVLDPESIRSLASQLLKANNDGKYMVFIQKNYQPTVAKFIEQFTTDELLAEIRRRMGT